MSPIESSEGRKPTLLCTRDGKVLFLIGVQTQLRRRMPNRGQTARGMKILRCIRAHR